MREGQGLEFEFRQVHSLLEWIQHASMKQKYKALQCVTVNIQITILTITVHGKKQKSVTQNQDQKKVPIETKSKMSQTLKWADKSFRAAIINMFKNLKENTLTENEWMEKPNRNSKSKKHSIWDELLIGGFDGKLEATEEKMINRNDN